MTLQSAGSQGLRYPILTPLQRRSYATHGIETPSTVHHATCQTLTCQQSTFFVASANPRAVPSCFPPSLPSLSPSRGNCAALEHAICPQRCPTIVAMCPQPGRGSSKSPGAFRNPIWHASWQSSSSNRLFLFSPTSISP